MSKRRRRLNFPAALSRPAPADIIRFCAYVRPNGSCWHWTGNTDEKGYGRFWMSGRNHWAHRASYAIFVGDIPCGLHVHHLCSDPKCVNPEHLRLEAEQVNSVNHRYRDDMEEILI